MEIQNSKPTIFTPSPLFYPSEATRNIFAPITDDISFSENFALSLHSLSDGVDRF